MRKGGNAAECYRRKKKALHVHKKALFSLQAKEENLREKKAGRGK